MTGSCWDTSIHPFLVPPHTDAPHITASWALASPTEEECRHGGMEERAQPAPAGAGGEGRSVAEAAVQRGER